jgi:voltage-gated potassium channel
MLPRRVIELALTIGLLITLGAAGFRWVEGWSLPDALYMTVITISTVGFGETRELSYAGRVFTSCLIMVSLVSMTCWTAKITSVIVEGDITGAFRQQRMKRMAGRLKNHVIICGSGVFSRSILELLFGRKNPIAVVCDDQQHAEFVREIYPDVPVIEQHPADEFALAQASLATARYVVAATSSDIDNLLIAMTCKQFNEKIHVYVLSLNGDLAGRMTKLGVDEVICPYLLSGGRVAELIDQNEIGGPDLPSRTGTAATI